MPRINVQFSQNTISFTKQLEHVNKKLGYLYSYLMAIYFLISGISVLFDISGKLERIGLSALDSDGEVAFVLIYSGLMVGIGVASLLIQLLSKSWVYAAVLTTTIVGSFIVFRIVGSLMIGFLSSTQIKFLIFEIVEVAVGVLLLWQVRNKKSK